MAELETIYKTEINDGVYGCGDVGISVKEWYNLLQSAEAKPYLETLFHFLREPAHTASCSTVSLKYGNTAYHYNAKVTSFSKWVQKKLNRFQVIGLDGKITYWGITMEKGWDTKQGFMWQLRSELVEALQQFLMNELIICYRDKEPFNGFDEEYKWELLDNCDGNGAIDIIKNLKGKNIVDNARVDGVLKNLCQTKEKELTEVVEHLLDESSPIDKRIADFKTEMKAICPVNWKICANDERTASAILMCKYPNQYTVYKDEVYQLICRYFGIESRKAGRKFSHFIEIIDKITARFGEEIQGIMMPSISKYKNKPLNLAVQTLFWCMRNEIKKKLDSCAQRYWLAGYSFGRNDSQLDRFLQEGIWECGYDDSKSSDRKLLEDAMTFSEGDIIILKSSSTKGPQKNIPFLRIRAIGIVQKENATLYTTDEGEKRCLFHVKYINTDERDFDGKVYGPYRKTLHLADEKVKDIIDYVNKILNDEIMPQQKHKEFIELLQETYNLVLNGAPGTGKTYMAHAIAEEMGAVTRFVQFHPSYDYTDFVEGLRPVEKDNGQIGFERRDGVFKDFCRDALKNLVDSAKSVESLSKEMSWQEQLNLFVEDAIESARKFKTVNGSVFTISDMRGHNIIVHIEQNKVSSQVAVNSDEILELLSNEVELNIVRDIRNYFHRKFGTQPDSYAFVITNAVRSMKKKVPTVSANKIDRKPFVFIIDEINRGEASKIFGELFYAIDPGYRGKRDHLVQTQYQNLIPETDVFAKGFFVPENVYILATMNDIDRSVESMDFAMRRRFTWKEITPDDTEAMLDDLACVEDAKSTMHRLNKAIAETDGLGTAYMIGPSYFLKLGDNGGDFHKLWEMNIEPLLNEYLRGFRKASVILDKFRSAYFNGNAMVASGENLELTDEN